MLYVEETSVQESTQMTEEERNLQQDQVGRTQILNSF